VEIGIGLFFLLMIGASLAVRLLPIIPEQYRIAGSLLVVFAFLCWAPFTLDNFRVFQLSRIAIWVIVAMGLNILTGYNGQISLGHGALVALGAYTAALLMDRKEQMGFIDAEPWPFWTTIIAAGIITAAIGFLLGFPALRLSGPYLAVATLALVISFPSIIRKYDDFTGGAQGIVVRQPEPPGFLADILDDSEWLYFLSLFIAALTLLIAWSILRGPLGRAFVAVRDSEVAAAAMGVNVAETKVAAFTISSFFAGVAGGLYTQVLGVVTPESIDIVTSINFLTAIVIGGLASILGAVIGAAVIILLPSDGPDLVGKLPLVDADVVKRAPGAIQGAIVIFVMLLMPYGIAGFYHRFTRATPSSVLRGVAGIPPAIWGRLLDTRESISESLEDLRWRRREPGPPGSREGG